MKAIYALSADPITNGHINIIERALKTFDHILVGIGINKNKKYTFTLDERETLTKKVLKKYGDKVTVKSYSGLLSDFAYENQIFNIIRGVRNSTDFDYEHLLFDINVGIDSGLETYIMVADKKLSHISSSAAKELQEYQAANILDYVPMIVKQALEKKNSHQLRIGVTGSIGCGKSYVTKKLQSWFGGSHEIDMDKIGRYILTESKEPNHLKIREILNNKFLHDILVSNNENVVDLKKLKYYLFDHVSCYFRDYFNEIMKEPTLHMVRKYLKDYTGIVFIQSALFAEMGFTELVNNNIILVDAWKDIQIERLKTRNYTDEEIENRLNSQLSNSKKCEVIQKKIEESNCGEIFVCINNSSKDNGINETYREIRKLYESF